MVGSLAGCERGQIARVGWSRKTNQGNQREKDASEGKLRGLVGRGRPTKGEYQQLLHKK
jgi:hypothetical protein